MNKEEFEKYIRENNIDIKKLNIVIGEKTNVPYSYGCFEENGLWKVYKVGERQDFSVVMEGTENEIFTFMNDIVEERYGDYLQGILKYNEV